MESVSQIPAERTRPTRGMKRVRQTLLPPITSEQHLGDSATLNAQFWFERLPLRITAGWSLAAGLLAGGVLRAPGALSWQTLVLLWLLADPLWGAIWRLAAGRTESLRLPARTLGVRGRLPYLEQGSPAAQLFGSDGPASLRLLYRVALPAVLVGLLVASALGVPALVLTVVVIGLGVAGWISVRVLHLWPFLLQAIVAVGLPWLLALILLDVNGLSPDWNRQLALLLLWVLHMWGANRALAHTLDWPAIGVMAVAALGIGVLMVVAQAPLWLALLALLWLPTWLAAYQRRALQSQQVWWLLAMLVSTLALGQAG